MLQLIIIQILFNGQWYKRTENKNGSQSCQITQALKIIYWLPSWKERNKNVSFNDALNTFIYSYVASDIW